MDPLQTASQFNKYRRIQSLHGKNDFVIRKKQISEELAYFKKRILEANERGDKENIKKYLEKIFKLNAEQLAISMKQDAFLFDPEEKKKIIAKYLKDSYLMIKKFNLE